MIILLDWALPVVSFGLALIATVALSFLGFLSLLSHYAATDSIKNVKRQIFASIGINYKITSIRELNPEQLEFFYYKFEGYYSPEKANVRQARLYYLLATNLQTSVCWLSAICGLFLAWDQATNYTSSIAFVYIWYMPLTIGISLMLCNTIAKWCLLTTRIHIAEIDRASLVATGRCEP
nr:hypothetical protein A152_21955 [Vibrio tasmaniensis 1F-187]